MREIFIDDLHERFKKLWNDILPHSIGNGL